MAERYDPFAVATPGLLPHDLPRRPATTALVAEAVTGHGNRLKGELRDSRAGRVVTLGNEALSVLSALADPGHGLPERLSLGVTYWQVHRVRIDGREVEVLPLVHPGQRAALWRDAHAGWVAARR